MAKIKATHPAAPVHLTMRLFAPGMTPLHRAGLGGLACTLSALERQVADGLIAKSKLPAPFLKLQPPWEMDEQSITLRFGEPDNAAAFLEKLFAFAFSVRDDGLIYLPGQFQSEPSRALLADLQSGLILTFLQHGKVRQLAKESTVTMYDPEGEGSSGLTVEYKKCSGFKHQLGWKEFVDKHARLHQGVMKIDGPISPGSVVRHVAFTSSTAAEDPPERMLPLYFAIVGCLALPVNRGVAALIVPEVENLLEFIFARQGMTPSIATDCLVANGADAGFRAQIRARGNATRQTAVESQTRQLASGTTGTGCHVMTFTRTPWASQQKSRVATIYVPPVSDQRLERFDLAFSHLGPRIALRTIKEPTGRGRTKTVSERKEPFRVDSVARPLIAENLARGKPWYAGFVDLMTKKNPATDKPYRDQLSYERKGLHDMIADKNMWDDEGEKTIVQAVHEALRNRYGQIANENQTNSAAMKNRFQGEYDRWRLAFAGAKNADQFRTSLCDLFSRAGRNAVLQQSWGAVLPYLRAKSWQHARDLALLALCSYGGKGAPAADAETETSDPTNT